MQRHLIEEQEKIENCYKHGELQRRLNKARIDIWYLPALSKNDVTKYGDIRDSLFVDAVNMWEVLINYST